MYGQSGFGDGVNRSWMNNYINAAGDLSNKSRTAEK
jgi:hypothetical protein